MTATTDTPTLDQQLDEQIEVLADQLFGAALGTAELIVAYFGRELGLYAALRDAGLSTVAEVAARAAVDARYAQEWLEHQAVAGVVTVDDVDAAPEKRRYTLPEAHAIVLLDEEHPAYSGALADIPPILARTIDLVASASRTGAGVPFAAYGLHDMQAGFTRPMFANALVAEWLPALPDVLCGYRNVGFRPRRRHEEAGNVTPLGREDATVRPCASRTPSDVLKTFPDLSATLRSIIESGTAPP